MVSNCSLPEWEKASSYVSLSCSFFINYFLQKSQHSNPNGLMLIGQWQIKVTSKSKKWVSPFHFIFNRITELDAACILLQWGVYCAAWMCSNVSVCCMNYQWEDGCAFAELKRFRLRCPLTAHWFDISIIDSKGDSDSWAAQSQMFSWFEAFWTCTQVEGLVGDY